MVGCEETSGYVNQEKLFLVVVWGPNLDTQLIPHITPLLLSRPIMEKKIARRGITQNILRLELWFLFIALISI